MAATAPGRPDAADFDVVVLGGGVAGLVTGSALALAGARTLVLERNSVAGGCLGSFRRAGFVFDSAVHWIAGLGPGGYVRRVFEEIGIGDSAAPSVRIDPPIRILTPTTSLSLPGNEAAFAETLLGAFPGERQLGAFLDRVRRTGADLAEVIQEDPDSLAGWRRLAYNAVFPLKHPLVALQHRKFAEDVAGRFLQSPELRRWLRCFPIFPDVSFVLFSWFARILSNGDCHYPVGGMGALARTLASRLVETGASLLCRAEAKSLLVDRGEVSGVSFVEAGRERTVSCRAVVSTLDPRETFFSLLPTGSVDSRFLTTLREQTDSESFFYVYLGLNEAFGRAGWNGTPTWFFPDPAECARIPGPLASPDFLGLAAPSFLDPSIAPPGKHCMVIGARLGEAERQQWGRDDGYQEKKDAAARQLIAIAGRAIPGLDDMIEVRECASPLTFERYTGNRLGASSGFSMAARESFKLDPVAPVGGLYLAGHWTMNPGGVVPSAVSGLRAARIVLSRLAGERPGSPAFSPGGSPARGRE